MARRRKGKAPLPAIGSAFAFPLGDGRFSVCRVISDCDRPGFLEIAGAENVLVATSGWIGAEVPVANDPALRPILHNHRFAYENEPDVCWFSEPPPPDFVSIGFIEPTDEERSMPCHSFGGWGGCRTSVICQWRWDHDRAALLAEMEEKKRAQEAAWVQAEQERREALRRLTLDQLAERRFLPQWAGGDVPSKLATASRKLLKKAVERLLAAGVDAPEGLKLAILQECIEGFNALDAKSQFINTIEREDICDEFDIIVAVCGLGDRENLADEWRDW